MCPGDVGSIPIGSANFDGPLSLGYRLSGKPRAGSNPAPAARWLGSHLASCPSLLLGMGRCALVIELVAQLRSEHLVKTGKMRVRSPPRNIEAVSCPSHTIQVISDGSQDW